MATVFIYALVDPVTGWVRYVGKAVNLKERFRKHLAQLKKRTYKTHWIRGLVSRGFKPVLQVLDLVPENDWQRWERAHIARLKELGCPLTNGTDGGDGCVLRGEDNPNFGKCGEQHPGFGKNLSLEVRKKISQAHLGKRQTEAAKQKIGDANRGRKASSETREKMSFAHSGDKHPMFGKHHSELSKLKMSAAKKGRLLSEQHRDALRAGWRLRRLTLQKDIP